VSVCPLITTVYYGRTDDSIESAVRDDGSGEPKERCISYIHSNSRGPDPRGKWQFFGRGGVGRRNVLCRENATRPLPKLLWDFLSVFVAVSEARDLVVFGAVWTALERRQFDVELLLTPDVKLGRRSNETNVDLAMNQLAVDVRTAFAHLCETVILTPPSSLYYTSTLLMRNSHHPSADATKPSSRVSSRRRHPRCESGIITR